MKIFGIRGSSKGLLAFFITMLILASFVNIVPVSAAASPNLVLTPSTQTLLPGVDNSISFKIENTAETGITGVLVTITLPPSSASGTPMILKNSDGRWSLGDIGGDAYTYFNATIYVSPSAANSLYQLALTIVYDLSTIRGPVTETETRTIGVSVPMLNRTGASISAILSVNQINAGKNNTVVLNLTNVGDADAGAVSGTVVMPSAQSGSSPLSLVGSDGKFVFESIGENQSESIPLTIYATPNSAGSAYSISVTTTYTDYLKTRQETKYLALVVAGTVNLVVLDTSTYPQNITIGQPFSLTVTLINLGTTTAQSVIVVPNDTSNIKPSSAQGIFLGDLTVNVPSSLTLTYTAGTISSGLYHLTIQFTFKDNLGRTLTTYLNVPVSLTVGNGSSSTSPEPQRGGLITLILLTVVIVIVVVVAVYLFRRRRASRRRE